MVVLVGGEAEFRAGAGAGAKAGATTAGAATSACGAAGPWSAETAVEAGAKASDAAIAADPINFSISKR